MIRPSSERIWFVDVAQLLDVYVARKAQVRPAYTLREPYEQEFVFRRPFHASNYAALTFRCLPAHKISLSLAAQWPTTLPESYCRELEKAVACGVVAGLLDRNPTPMHVCQLSLVRIGWDDLGSSEEAFYQAALGAMAELRRRGPWELITSRV